MHCLPKAQPITDVAMLFSVIIPTFNRRQLLQQALASVWKQDITGFEIIVIDDGSTDGTLEYLRGLSGLRVICQPNRGPGAARNAGAEIAQGEYLAFLDSDDLWLPWTLGTFAQLIKAHQSPAILSACLRAFDEGFDIGDTPEAARAVTYADYFAGGIDGYYVGSNMAVLRRDLFWKAGGFSTLGLNAEDHDLILRMGTEPGFVQILAPITLGWRQHGASETKDLGKTFRGVRHLIQQERRGVYPGGRARSNERRDIIARHVRAAALTCLKNGLHREAWSLYSSTFQWHVKLRRWKFISGFPAKAVFEVASS